MGPASGRPVIDILMYHSISDRGGPTCIPRDVFAMQMQAVADTKVPVIALDDLLAARSGHADLPPRSVIITFDDGFQDFAETAWPVMSRHGFRPIVYLPTGFVGRSEGWRGIADPPRGLMGWDTIRTLARDGVMFGSHTISHPDLMTLKPGVLDDELALSKAQMEAELGTAIRHFAPPYGRAGPTARARIGAYFETSVGTMLGQATQDNDPLSLPRIEMFYFMDDRRWRAQLEGRGAAYLARRKLLRAVRGAVLKPWTGIRVNADDA